MKTNLTVKVLAATSFEYQYRGITQRLITCRVSWKRMWLQLEAHVAASRLSCLSSLGKSS